MAKPSPSRAARPAAVASDLALVATSSTASTGAMVPEEIKAAVLTDLATGKGLVQTCRRHGISEHTISALRDAAVKEDAHFAEAYFRHRMGAKLLNLASAGTDRMLERVGDIPLGALPVAVGVAIDKYLALSGQVAQIHEHRVLVAHMGVNEAIGAVLDGAVGVEHKNMAETGQKGHDASPK